jgi:hypothetical protein
MWRSMGHAAVRWVSAVFTGVEGVARSGDWPSLYGFAATGLWLAVTVLLVAPEVLRLFQASPRTREVAAAMNDRAWVGSSLACMAVSLYLFYLSLGGAPMPGEHL